MMVDKKTTKEDTIENDVNTLRLKIVNSFPKSSLFLFFSISPQQLSKHLLSFLLFISEQVKSRSRNEV
jgi:hypothetical protein